MTIKTELMTHQGAAVAKLKGLKVGGLFMDMGTGKSLTLLELCYQRRHKIDRVIYFCPVNLKPTAAHEIAKHSNAIAYVFSDKTTMGKIPDAHIYIVGVESIGQSDRVTLCANDLITDKSLVIIDESDTCKNHKAIRTQRLTQMAFRAKYRFIATGTPVGEGVVDLYAQMYFLSPDILGYKSFYSFARNHLEYSEEHKGLIVRSLNTDVIAAKIEPFVYQVKKDECLDLPDRQYLSRYMDLTQGQQVLYQRAKEEILMSVPDDEIDSYTIFRLFTALREIVSGFWNQTPHPESWRCKNNLREPVFHTCEHDRLDALEEAISTFPGDSKIIIWANFQYCAKQIIERLTGAYGSEAIATYTGETQDREGEIERWRGPADLPRYLAWKKGKRRKPTRNWGCPS
jgi:hypothetical protein